MDDITTGDDIIEQHWPYDGPHDDHSTVQAARAIEHLVRYLNNATGPGHRDTAVPYASTGYRVVTGVAGATGLLPQLLGQLVRFFTDQSTDPTLYDDRRGRPGAPPAGVTAMAVVDWLQEAVHRCHVLEGALRSAAVHGVYLGNDMPTQVQDVHNGMEGENLG